MHVRQQHRANAGRRQRQGIPIPRLKAPLLKHAAIDHHPLASDFEAITATGDLAIRAEEMELHEGSGFGVRVQNTSPQRKRGIDWRRSARRDTLYSVMSVQDEWSARPNSVPTG